MLQAPQRTNLSGPTLVRLLARLTHADVRASRQSLSDALSQWLAWTDAIALSAALNGSPPAAAGTMRVSSTAEANECARVRSTLAEAIAADTGFAPARRRGPTQAPAPVGAVDYPVFRQRYLSLQQTMETGIADLRNRLRGMLAARAQQAARLATLDAVMERALLARERSLLAAVPNLLEGHFKRLREAEQAALAEAAASGEAVPAKAGAWLDAFRNDMRNVLLAELDVRLQPAEGLLAALRAS